MDAFPRIGESIREVICRICTYSSVMILLFVWRQRFARFYEDPGDDGDDAE